MSNREDERWAAADLFVVVLVVAVAAAVVTLPVVRETPLRAVVLVPFLLLAPGYALVALVYPTEPAVTVAETETRGVDDPRLGGLTRLALSFGGSVAVVVAVGLGSVATVGYSLRAVAPGVFGVTLALTGAAWWRRRRAHPGISYRVDWTVIRRHVGVWFREGDVLDSTLTVVVVACVLLAGAGVYVQLTGPTADTNHVSLLAPDGSGGYTAGGYTRNLTVGTPARYALGISNDRPTNVDATVVAVLERYDHHPSSGASLGPPVNQTTLTRLTVPVDANGTTIADVTVQPTAPGADDRLVFLVYYGAVPDTPTSETADNEVHLWVTVRPANGG